MHNYKNISLRDIWKLTMIRNGKLALLRYSAWHCSKLMTVKKRDSGIASKIFHNATFKNVHCPHRGLNCVHDEAGKPLQNEERRLKMRPKGSATWMRNSKTLMTGWPRKLLRKNNEKGWMVMRKSVKWKMHFEASSVDEIRKISYFSL